MRCCARVRHRMTLVLQYTVLVLTPPTSTAIHPWVCLWQHASIACSIPGPVYACCCRWRKARTIDGTMRLACRTSRAAARLRGVDTKLVCTSVSWCGEWCTCYSFAALSACHHEGDVIYMVYVPWAISFLSTVRHPYSRIVPPPPCSFRLL